MNHINNAIENFTVVHGKINIKNIKNFLFFVMFRYFPMMKKSVRFSKIINDIDASHIKKNNLPKSHAVTHSQKYDFKIFQEYFLSYFKETLSNNISSSKQNIFLLSDLQANNGLKIKLEEYVKLLKIEFGFLPNLVQNAYFVKDLSSIKVAAHSFHKDGLGIRYKVWFILEANGNIGLEYKERTFNSNDEYATYKSVYGTTELNKNDITSQQAVAGQLYCMDTECLHRGYMKNDSNRTALVFEFIDNKKMSLIEGQYSSFHSNSKINDMFNF